MSLTGAEHRGLRELYAGARQLAGHWSVLATRLGGEAAGALSAGATACRELLAELPGLTEPRGVPGFPGAQAGGSWFAALRNGGGDRLLERNQALRLAVLDAAHLATLLSYLAGLADGRGDAELAAAHRRWEARLREAEGAVRGAALAEARDPERAVLPADPTPLGRAGHAIAYALGALGERLDRTAAARAARRARG
jgi:hypothetical protein